MKINFDKYQGTGNDFIIVDNRKAFFNLKVDQIKQLCDRRFGVGADGLMLLEGSDEGDFKMVYYNSDGNPSSMCGNGGRCIVAFANKLNVIGSHCIFKAPDGLHEASIQNDRVKLKMNDVSEVLINKDDLFVDTGSPHVVKFYGDVDAVNVFETGRSVRNEKRFMPAGTNVNFVELEGQTLKVRTYERGVEDETYSCGTGVTAAAVAAFNQGMINTPVVDVLTKGGNLKVHLEKSGNLYKNIYLEGKATFVFSGEINVE